MEDDLSDLKGEYTSLKGGSDLRRRWHSISGSMKIAILVIIGLSAIALAFFIATIVLATKDSDSSTTQNPCPVSVSLCFTILK